MKTLLIIIFIIVAFFISPCYAEDSEDKIEDKNEWSTLDKSLFVTYTVFNVAEILQTRYIFESDDYTEANPVMEPLGKNGTTVALIGINIAAYFVADWFSEEGRPWFLGTITAIKVGSVGYNAYVGVGFEF